MPLRIGSFTAAGLLLERRSAWLQKRRKRIRGIGMLSLFFAARRLVRDGRVSGGVDDLAFQLD